MNTEPMGAFGPPIDSLPEEVLTDLQAVCDNVNEGLDSLHDALVALDFVPRYVLDDRRVFAFLVNNLNSKLAADLIRADVFRLHTGMYPWVQMNTIRRASQH